MKCNYMFATNMGSTLATFMFYWINSEHIHILGLQLLAKIHVLLHE